MNKKQIRLLISYGEMMQLHQKLYIFVDLGSIDEDNKRFNS